MSKFALVVGLATALLVGTSAFAVDGQVLINQSTVMAAGGFPYRITQPGSYKLSGNLVVPADTDGIDVYASNVTVDLNGFTISHPIICSGSGPSLSCPFTGVASGINSLGYGTTVRNGSVTGFSYYGIVLLGRGNLVEDVHGAFNESGIGVYAGVVRRSTSSDSYTGISATKSTVTENVLIANRDAGLRISGGLFGSNTLADNGRDIVGGAPSISQNNNSCNGNTC